MGKVKRKLKGGRIIKQNYKANPLKLRKNQKCWLCKKEIKGNWCYNGHFWHEKCKNKDTMKRITEYLANLDKN